MANIITKRGSVDNVVTYEHICDTSADIVNINPKYVTLGSTCVVIQGDSGGLEVYIANNQKQWMPLMINSDEGETGISFHICTNEEVTQNGLPNIEFPSETTIYLVADSEDDNNLYSEFIYVDEDWERIGGVSVDLSGYLHSDDIAAWAKAAQKPTYTAAEVGALPSNTAIPTKVSDLEDDSGHYTKPATGIPAADLEETYLTSYTETDPTVPAWAKAATKPTYTAQEVGALPVDTQIPTIPTNVSAFNNDAGYLTAHQDISGKVDAVEGKGLSTNDFTDEYKEQLDNLAEGGGGGSMTKEEVAAAFAEHYGETVCYTLAIDETLSDCNTACSYADDAYGMTKGSADWDSMPIFKDIKPCVFKDGEVVYYLNPDNWNETVDGEASDLTGTDGDVMIEFPKFAYRIYRSGNILYVSVTNDMWLAAVDSRFNLDAFSRIVEGDLEHFYQGAYQGYVDANNKLRSIAGVLPTGSKTITAFRTCAQANGPHYQQNIYSHTKALQCLYLIKYGNRNGQLALGMGNVSGNGAALLNGYNAKSGGTMDTTTSTAEMGMYFGDTSLKTKHMRFAGVEDFWGNLSDWVDGLTTDSSMRLLINTDYSGETDVKLRKFISECGRPSNLSGSGAKKVCGNSIEGFMALETQNSTSQYWPDYARLYASCVLSFGGYCAGDLNAGPFYLDAYNGASSSGAYIGSRLVFH